ncbi:MAG TPA: hypothetical protein VHT29_10570 [Solirubrobacteraceae bacterium]|nr:hypothetical protein [Solirubrobacteraceae bacterium]
MTHLRTVAGHLSYSNIVATIALFVALGGASYAAVVIPAHSIGPRQLRPGAVTQSALAFPLGSAGVSDTNVESLYKGFCNAPNPPGISINGTCKLPRRSGITTPGREVHVSLRTPGRLLVSAIAGLRSEGPASATVHLSVEVVLDGRPAGGDEVVLTGSQMVQEPLQRLLAVGAGNHSVGIDVEGVRYSSYMSSDTLVTPVSLVVSALPAL